MYVNTNKSNEHSYLLSPRQLVNYTAAASLLLSDLLDAPVLDSLSVDSCDTWQQFAVLLPA